EVMDQHGFAVIQGFTETSGDVAVQGGSKGYVNPKQGEQAVIHFRAEEPGNIKICIYNLQGSLVKEMSKDTSGGEDSMAWSCVNGDGSMVASGVYIVYVRGPGIDTTTKMAIVK
ncbi:MAG: T9SS type A sorting domain-containing protein, partial [Elusimicrobia bacterium]|nr:T9SS type A sorting domain-containing protein [Elusimicrobiota bacterium]MBD3411666.1 T9SS type A sorting domain-containing protein [Elusimicrobiota bacterium]